MALKLVESRPSQKIFFSSFSYKLMLVCYFFIFILTKSFADNLTQVRQISIIAANKKIIAVLNSGQNIAYDLLGEKVTDTYSKGNMGLVITTKNILGINIKSQKWVRQAIEGEWQFHYSVGENIIILSSNKRVYALTVSSQKWEISSLESFASIKILAKDYTGGVFMDNKVLAFSCSKNKWSSLSLNGGKIIKHRIFDKTLLIFTSRNTINYNCIKDEFIVTPTY